eukprot:g215.t1
MKVNKSQERLISGLLAGPVRKQRKFVPKRAARSKIRPKNAIEVAGARTAAPPLSPAEPLPLPAVSIGADGTICVHEQGHVTSFADNTRDAAVPNASAPFLERVAARYGEWRDAGDAAPATRSAANAVGAAPSHETTESPRQAAVDQTADLRTDRDAQGALLPSSHQPASPTSPTVPEGAGPAPKGLHAGPSAATMAGAGADTDTTDAADAVMSANAGGTHPQPVVRFVPGGAPGSRTRYVQFRTKISRTELRAASKKARAAAAAAAAVGASTNASDAGGAKSPVPVRPAKPRALKHVAGCTCAGCRQERRLKSTRSKVPEVRYHRVGVTLLTAVMEGSGLKPTSKADWNVMWTLQHLKSYHYQALQRHQYVNQFPRTHECTKKTSLARNISRMGLTHGQRSFDFVPVTFLLPKERDLFRKHWERCRRDARDRDRASQQAQLQKHTDGSAAASQSARVRVPWMVKPASSACGRGIYITEQYDECPTEGLDEFVVTKYIPDPLLLNGLKFDLRLYVAVSSFNPLVIYLYEEGLARFATERYEHGRFDNPFMHLTNYSINKKSSKFQQNRGGAAGVD